MLTINNKYVLFFVLIVLSIIAYYPSFSVPFYLDDFESIANNTLLKTGTWLNAYNTEPSRWVGVFSFKLNFLLFGENISALHGINLAIHLVNTLLTFLLLKTLLTLSSKQQHDTYNTFYIALLGAAVFALHPLNTQAVTYIVQRYASLATLFFLLSLLSYLKARTATTNLKTAAFSLLCFITFLLAFFTKQNTITLLAVLAVFELALFNKIKISSAFKAFGVALLLGVILYLIDFDQVNQIANKIDNLTRETDQYTRLEYLTMQFNVLWVYIGKWLMPIWLRLEYPFNETSFTTFSAVIAGLAHLVVFSCSLIFIKKKPLIACGALFFYITHSVESGFVPIKDVAFEHRNYLPSIGLCMILVGVVTSFKINRNYFIATSLPVIILLTGATFLRNQLWQDPIAFYQNELKLEANNLRVRTNLAYSLEQQGKQTLADEQYAIIDSIIQSNERKIGLTSTVLNNVFGWHMRTGNTTRANSIANRVFESEERKPWLLAKLHYGLGRIAMHERNADVALDNFKKATQLQPEEAIYWIELTKAFGIKGQLKKAQNAIKKATKLQPNNQEIKRLQQLIESSLATHK